MKCDYLVEWLLSKQQSVRPESKTAYVLAAALITAATLLHLALAPWLIDTLFAILSPTVILTAIFVGPRAGVFALVLASASMIVFIEEPGTLPRHALGFGIFIVFGALVVAIISALQSAVAREKRLHADLRANEGRFQGLMETAPDAMVIETADRRIREVNSQAEALFGYRRDELIGRSVEILIPEKDRAAFAGRHKNLPKHPQAELSVARRELTLVRKDGTEIPVEVSANPVHTEDGIFICVAVRDLSQRKMDEETLRVSEERYRALAALLTDAIDAFDDGIALYDADDRLILMNKAIKDNPMTPKGFALGRTYEEITRAFWAGSELEKDTEAFERFVAADVAKHRRADGTREEHRVSDDMWIVNRDFRTRDGAVLHIASDLSALMRAKEMAEQANLAKSRFLAAASHDLRQPLQTIALLQGVLQNTATDPRSQGIIDKLGASIDSMSYMLNSLLELNQLEAGVVAPDIKNFRIGDLLEKICAELRLHADLKHLDLRHIRSGAMVRSDPSLLEQIIRNLLSNAIKYTNQGKILVGCRHYGDTLRIEVLDTGIGIAEDQIKAIFEEFRQIDNPARDRRKGLGLGLSIAQRLANLLGHKIDVRAIPDRGSAFSIEVPVGEPPDAAPTHDDASPLSAEALKILLVEDDAGVRWSLQTLLELLGHSVVTAENADGALARLKEGDWRPHVIVSDFNLPGGTNGLELVKRARSELGTSIRAVLLTGDVYLTPDTMISIPDCVLLKKPADPTAIVAAARGMEADQPPSEQLA
jgi:PAS domain S-box-containing protein